MRPLAHCAAFTRYVKLLIKLFRRLWSVNKKISDKKKLQNRSESKQYWNLATKVAINDLSDLMKQNIEDDEQSFALKCKFSMQNIFKLTYICAKKSACYSKWSPSSLSSWQNIWFTESSNQSPWINGLIRMLICVLKDIRRKCFIKIISAYVFIEVGYEHNGRNWQDAELREGAQTGGSSSCCIHRRYRPRRTARARRRHAARQTRQERVQTRRRGRVP